METFGKSQPVRRREDLRFLTGGGRYVDDLAPEGALHGYVLRAQVAHARITALDVTEARSAPGVHLVVTAQDMLAAGADLYLGTLPVRNRDGSPSAQPKRPALAQDKVRFVGEALAMVFAESLQQARDAAELIAFEYEDAPAHVALATGGPVLHDEAPDNRAFDWAMGNEAAVARAEADAAHVVEMDVADNRIIVASLEPRGVFAEWDGARLHVAVNGQGVWGTKTRLAEALGLPEAQVRVTNPDVGGGFGMKAMFYPETLIAGFAARQLGRAVRWMSDRSEAMLSDNAGRDLTHRATLAFDADLRLTSYRVHSLCNLGAYNSQMGQIIQTELFSKVLTGVYDVQDIYLRVEGIYTNTTQVDAYRGAGRPEAIYLMERMMDRAARELGVDPLELRRRNFIAPARFPYKTATGEMYDVGAFDRVLDHARASADLAGFERRRDESQAAGKLRGLGLCYYIESILGDPAEDVKVVFTENGGAQIYVGTQSNGQGHETVYAQFLADQTGIPVERIEVVQGDSDLIPRGGGTGGSRSATVQAHVTLKAVGEIIKAHSAYIAEQFEVTPEDVQFDDEAYRVTGKNVTLTMLEVAALARAAQRDDLLSFDARAELPGRSYPNGAHFAEVEIDPETGASEVVRYTVVDDFGNLLNPLLVEGQIHGGVAQGIGQAMTERVVYDSEGQLLTASLMDYALPRAYDMPWIRFETEPVPSTANPLGMKGCGEAGTVGALAAVANAMQDAMWDRGVRQADMPFTPARVWAMLKETPPVRR